MSEAKFTNGPWVAISNGSYFDIGPATEDLIIPVYPNVCIGVMHYDKANAHLIAAAPEMYEMLNAISDAIELGQYELLQNFDICKLLSKARGESND